jgi:DNA-nicking Smr family endonuclease
MLHRPGINAEAEPVKHKASKHAPAKMEPPAPLKPKAPPPIAAFDRKKVRKIRSGQVDIEARIDLHGMRQDEAHVALVGFLHRCQNKGQRWVLVITGKGKLSDRYDEAPFDMTRQRERGVLKRNVPRWLDEPEIRALVVSYTTAAIQHGGEGALYVHLRKRG